ncbi:MAG: hypothetical protein V4608_04765 [Bacteroidota bacterium]
MNKNTKWKNADDHSLPTHGQTVLISVDGINYFAVFNTAEMGFELKIDPQRTVSVKDSLVYWMELNL